MSDHPRPSEGRLTGKRHYFPVRVYYEDTDLSGIVYHANYLKFCERARSNILEMLGIDQRAAVEAGLGAYAVAEAQIAWKRPARLGDCLVVESCAKQLRAASVRMYQRVLRVGENESELLAEVNIRVGFVAPDGRPIRQPEEWRAKFAEFAQPDETPDQTKETPE